MKMLPDMIRQICLICQIRLYERRTWVAFSIQTTFSVHGCLSSNTPVRVLFNPLYTTSAELVAYLFCLWVANIVKSQGVIPHSLREEG